MSTTETAGPISIADVIAGVRYSLSFDAKGHLRSVKKRASKRRNVLERIPAANGYQPHRDGAVTLSPFHRSMEKRWRELSWIVQGACRGGLCTLRGSALGRSLSEVHFLSLRQRQLLALSDPRTSVFPAPLLLEPGLRRANAGTPAGMASRDRYVPGSRAWRRGRGGWAR